MTRQWIGSQVTDLSCTLGADCTLALTGHNLADTNGLVILAEGQCGDADGVVADWGDAATQVSRRAKRQRCNTLVGAPCCPTEVQTEISRLEQMFAQTGLQETLLV